MGLTDDYRTGYDVPAEVDGHRLWYAGAVGTEPLTADLILQRASEAGASVDYDAEAPLNAADGSHRAEAAGPSK